MSLDNSVSVMQVTESLKEMLHRNFPKSFVNMTKGALGGEEHGFIRFALGNEKEWINGIVLNDVAYHLFSITQERGKFVIEAVSGSLTLKPTQTYLYSSSLKVFRKISNTDHKKLEKSFEAFITKLKAAIKANHEDMNYFAKSYDVLSKI